jgi:hypothetical protein
MGIGRIQVNAFQKLSTALNSQLNPVPEHLRLERLRSVLKGCDFRSGDYFDAAIQHLPIGGAYARGDQFPDAVSLFSLLRPDEIALLENQYQKLMSSVGVEFPILKAEFPKQFS